MECEGSKICGKIKAYASWLNFHNQEKHLVLFCNNHLFDLNSELFEVRPYNSIFWYKINMEKYCLLCDYFDEIFESIKEISFEEADIPDSLKNIGIYIDNILALDLNKLNDFLIKLIKNCEEENLLKNSSKDILDEFKVETEQLSIELENFMNNISIIHDGWNSALLKLTCNDELHDIFNFKIE